MKCKEKKTIFLSAAGTGGHLFPAQMVAEELQDEYNIVFLGKNLSKNPYFQQKKFSYFEVEAATFSLRKPLTLFKALGQIAWGVYTTLSLVKKMKPQLVVGFGSFFSLPILWGARIKKIPLVLHEQNVLPGRVNRFFSKKSVVTAISFEQSKSYLKGATKQVTFPQKFQKKTNKDEALHYFGIEKQEGIFCLLIFGGSQGAHFLNDLSKDLAIQMKRPGFHLLHFVGKKSDPLLFVEYYRKEGIAATVKAFEPRMDLAYAAADFVICRSGAATINELIVSENPALLIPFPHAIDDHQTVNAQFFVDDVGGGWFLPQKEATISVVRELLLSCTMEKLLAKKKKMQEYREEQHDRLSSFATLIKSLV